MTFSVTPTSSALITSFQDRSGHFLASLEIEMFRASRYERPLAMMAVALGVDLGGGIENVGYRRLFLDKRLRMIAPDILRVPDFWGRYNSGPFLFVLPETPVAGAAAVAKRFTESPIFIDMLEVDRGRSQLQIGVAELSEDFPKAKDFVKAAVENVVWRHVEPDDEAA